MQSSRAVRIPEVVLAVLALTGVLPVSQALDGGATVTTSVVADKDMTTYWPYGLTVGADNITIDGNGHSLTYIGYVGAGEQYGIYCSGRSNIIIKNFSRISGFDHGFRIFGGSNIVLENCRLEGNAVTGIFAANASGLTIRNCTIRETCLGMDFSIGSANLRLNGNLVTGGRAALLMGSNTTVASFTGNRLIHQTQSPLPNNRRLFRFKSVRRSGQPGESFDFACETLQLNGSPDGGSSFAVRSVPAVPAGQLTWSRSGNQISGRLVPSRPGLHALVVDVTDSVGNSETRLAHLLVGPTAERTTKYFWDSKYPMHGQTLRGGYDTGGMRLTPPTSTAYRECGGWVQESPDQLPYLPAVLLRSADLNLLLKFAAGSNDALVGLEREATYSVHMDKTADVPEAWENAPLQWGSFNVGGLNWLLDYPTEWYYLSAKFLANDPWVETGNPTQTSHTLFRYLTTTAPEVRTVASERLLLLAATADPSGTGGEALTVWGSGDQGSLVLANAPRPLREAASEIRANRELEFSTGIVNGELAFTTVPLEILPAQNAVSVTVTAWPAANGPWTWSETAVGAPGSVWHALGGLIPGRIYRVAAGGTEIFLGAADANGKISFVYQQAFPAHFTATLFAQNQPPAFVSPPAATPNPAGVGQSIAFAASATDPDGDPLAYLWDFGDGTSAPGAAVPHAYGAAGAFSARVTVNDGKGGNVFYQLTITINQTAPAFTTQPANVTVTAGQTATFSVTASGTAPLAYQWRKNGVHITGATASSYTTPATTAADNGALFSVVVSNSAGSATSSNAALMVNAVPVNKPPLASLTAPANGTVYVAPSNILLTASASDPDGTVAKVQFHSGTTLLGEDFTAPYSFSWNSVGAGTYSVTATAVDNLGLAGTSAPVTIKLIPTVTVSYVDAWSSEPGADTGRFQVSRTSLTTAPLTVFYSLGGTATNGSDYQSLSGSLTIPAGASATSLYVVPLDDTAVEGKETVTFTLAANANYKLGTAIGGTVNLLDNELPVVTMGVRDGWAAEPGTDIGQFTLSRTGATAAPLAVKYTLAGSAVNGSDYRALSGTATIPAGAASVHVDIVPLSDSLVENIELVTLALQENAAYQTGSALTGTLRLLDDDMPVVGVTATDAIAMEPADPGTFMIARGGNLGVAVTVYYTLGGSATKGTDYAAPSGSVTIPAGAASAAVTIAPLDDLLAEGREYATLYLSANAAYQINGLSGAVVYLYDDEKPEVRLAVTDSYVSETGPDAGVYTVTCTPPAKGTLAVKYALGGTATAGTDYAALGGSVSIPAGGTSATITVLPKDDTAYEGNETVSVALLADAAYQAYWTGAYTVTLRDDESTVSVSLSDSSCSEPGTNTGLFRFSRAYGSNAGALTVYFTVSGTAAGGTDYVSLPGSAAFAAGSAYAYATLTPKDDAAVEGPETVVLTLSANAAYKIGTASATLTIADND